MDFEIIVMEKTPIPFRAFDESGDVRIYESGILPHWRQAGCTYFVTFRLADSLPVGVVKESEYERTMWLKARGIDSSATDWKRELLRLSPSERRPYERLVGGLLNKSLDECYGSCILKNQELASIVATALDHFHGVRVLTGEYVIMANHVHVLLTPINDFELEDILHSVKSYTAKEINRALNQRGQIWQRDSYDHIVRDLEQLQAYQVYIAANPAKANLRPGDCLHQRAAYYV